MKRIIIFTIFVLFGLISINAQGGFKVGANIGLPLSSAGDVSSFNMGADIAYLIEVMDNLEVGGLIGYTHYFGDGTYNFFDVGEDLVIKNYVDTSFLPIASSARYYFADHKFFGGVDLGYAINVSGEADSGFYIRPKFGFNLGKLTLIASYTSISGGVNVVDNYYGGYNNVVSLSGFNSFNVGVELGL